MKLSDLESMREYDGADLMLRWWRDKRVWEAGWLTTVVTDEGFEERFVVQASGDSLEEAMQSALDTRQSMRAG
ncbi:MAG: hypothetical protein R3330_02925 [Saprospiraceae bacterium]|nr:hypothetical protein [Saprospiraceae bacterium]